MTTLDSLYRQVMGPSFDTLAPELQIFHSMTGSIQLSGRCSVTGPQSMVGKILGWIFGLPQTTDDVALRFDLDADSRAETWRRHFPGRLMISRMRVVNGVLVERLGPVNLHFALEAEQGRLHMLLHKIQVGIISCPRFLIPAVLAEENATPGKLHFKVAARLPLLGLLVAYQGYLNIPAEEGKP